MKHAWFRDDGRSSGPGPADETLLLLLFVEGATVAAAVADAVAVGAADAAVGDVRPPGVTAGVAAVAWLLALLSSSSESPLSSSKSLNASSLRDLTTEGDGVNEVGLWAHHGCDFVSRGSNVMALRPPILKCR